MSDFSSLSIYSLLFPLPASLPKRSHLFVAKINFSSKSVETKRCREKTRVDI